MEWSFQSADELVAALRAGAVTSMELTDEAIARDAVRPAHVGDDNRDRTQSHSHGPKRSPAAHRES